MLYQQNQKYHGNTGNIARTCAAIGTKLHLVRPLGFSLEDKYVKRAGLDYWDKLEIEEHNSFEKFLEKYKPDENPMFFVTTKGKNGTGLGLFMSYSTIRGHFNGNITFESELGKGTVFHVIFRAW